MEAEIPRLFKVTEKDWSFASCNHPNKLFAEAFVFRNFTKFTGKHLYQTLFLNKVAGLRPEISKNTFFYRTPPVAASV